MNRKSWLWIGAAGLVLGAISLGCASKHCSAGGMPATTTAAAVSADGAAAAQPKFVNTRCPIMGNAIDPASVPDRLTREYRGQRVAFCCAMCPPAWDKLSDAQKDAKLKAVE